MDINNTILEEIEKEFCSKLEQDFPESQKRSVEELTLSSVDDVIAHDSEGNVITPLHNSRDPRYVLQTENIGHRAVVVLKAAGLSQKEIAAKLNVSLPYVGYVLKQSWAEKLLLEQLHGSVDSAMQYLQEAAVGAAKRLVEIAETATNIEVKRKANNDILDRKYGKPNQPHSMTTKAANELTDEELSKHLQSN